MLRVISYMSFYITLRTEKYDELNELQALKLLLQVALFIWRMGVLQRNYWVDQKLSLNKNYWCSIKNPTFSIRTLHNTKGDPSFKGRFLLQLTYGVVAFLKGRFRRMHSPAGNLARINPDGNFAFQRQFRVIETTLHTSFQDGVILGILPVDSDAPARKQRRCRKI